MSGASGLYVDARKALQIGMVTPGAVDIVQFGNTSIGLARKLIFGEVTLESLREFAKKLRATHCMFATAPVFKDLYSIEYSIWCGGMPYSEYNNMLDLYNLPHLPDMPDAKDVKVTRLAVRDLPDTEKCKVHIIKAGTVLTGILDGCIGCKKCMKACPEQALTIVAEGVSQYRANIESDRCAGTACRRCEAACPKDVIHTSELKTLNV